MAVWLLTASMDDGTQRPRDALAPSTGDAGDDGDDGDDEARLLALKQAIQLEREANAALLEEARRERALMMEETRTIERANQILEFENERLVEERAALDRERAHYEERIRQEALGLAADRAQQVEENWQSHGAAWLSAVSETVRAECKTLQAVLVAANRHSSVHDRPVQAPQKALHQTWKQALEREVRSALAPLRDALARQA